MNLRYPTRIALTALSALFAASLVLAALFFPHIEREIDVVNVLFVIDITDSMEVADVRLGNATMSRAAYSQATVRQAIQSMPCGSKAGLAVFSDARALVLMNPVDVCHSYHDLLQIIPIMDGRLAWAKASEIAKATYNVIRQTQLIDEPVAVAFFTDGHESPPLHETLYPKFDGTPGAVPGVFIGVGGSDLQPIPKRNAAGELAGFWAENEVLHLDAYTTTRGELRAIAESRPRLEHLSSQKSQHLEWLASMVGFGYLDMPSSQILLAELHRQVAQRNRVVTRIDPYAFFAWLALGLLVFMYAPSRLFRRWLRF